MKRNIFIISILVLSSSLFAETTLDKVKKLDEQIKVLRLKLVDKINVLKKVLDSNGQKLFAKEQSAWEKYVQTKVNFAANEYKGGTLSRVVALETLLKEVKARLKQIEEYLEI